MNQKSDKIASFHASLLEILEAAMQVDGATKGNVQLLDEKTGELRIVVQIGFDEAFLQTFEHVRIDDPSACGRAMRLKRRIIISDINHDILYGAYLSVAMANKYQAVQSTPIMVADGSVRGVFSTHYPMAHLFSNTSTKCLDACAIKMAKIIMEYSKAERALVRPEHAVTRPKAHHPKAASHHRTRLRLNGRRAQ